MQVETVLKGEYIGSKPTKKGNGILMQVLQRDPKGGLAGVVMVYVEKIDPRFKVGASIEMPVVVSSDLVFPVRNGQ